MKRNISTFLFITFLCISKFTIADMAVMGEPLKERYQIQGAVKPIDYYQTGETADSFSIICDMGKAIPDTKQEGDWYINKSIPGLKLELRARAVSKGHDNTHIPTGFVVITKNEEILKVFKPLGEYKDGKWEGDIFNYWCADCTDIAVSSELLGKDGYASFDLLDGMGFYYKSKE